jgi:hypothetical protein
MKKSNIYSTVTAVIMNIAASIVCNKRIILLLVLLVVVFLNGCGHYYYVTNVQNVPLFKEKNEYRITAAYGGGDVYESSSYELQGAYSVTNHIGIISNFMYAKAGEVSERNYGKGTYFEGAIGYFEPIGGIGVFEIYGGYGIGKQHHEYNDYWTGSYYGSSDLSLNKFFLQPSLGLTFNAFDAAFSSRLCRLSFNRIDYQTAKNSSYNSEDKIKEFNDMSSKSHLFVEPALTLRGGWKNVKVQYQLLWSIYSSNPKMDFGEQTHHNIGLYFAIADRYR